MPKLNENYLNVQDSYLFAEIARRVKAYEEARPDKAASIIRLGIGDVTRPLTKSAIGDVAGLSIRLTLDNFTIS